MPTRFYFPNIKAPISPAFSTFWSGTSEGTRFRLTTAKGSDAIVTGNQINLLAGATAKHLDRQYISDPLWGNQSITGTVTGQLMTREYVTTDNVDAIVSTIKIIDNKGTTTRGTLLGSGVYGGINEFINNASHRNARIFQNNTVTVVNALDGDRVVIELGFDVAIGGGTTPQATAKYGTNATDLPGDETTNSDGAGWFQFNHMNLRFKKNICCEVNDEGCI